MNFILKTVLSCNYRYNKITDKKENIQSQIYLIINYE